MNDNFLNNKYTKWYGLIVSNSDTRGYTEKHHIIPRCMGGTDEATNIVKLSARQHFVCHLLLTKMAKLPLHRGKLCYALRCMVMMARKRDGQRYFPKSSRLFQICRTSHKGIAKTEKHKLNLSKSKLGVKLGPASPIAKANMSKAQKARGPRTESEKNKIAASLRGRTTWMKGKTHTLESKEKMSSSQKERIRAPASKHSQLAIENNRAAQQKFLYTVESPSGQQFKIIDMKKFCQINDLPYHRLADKKQIMKPIKDSGHIKNKQHVGWKTVSAEKRAV